MAMASYIRILTRCFHSSKLGVFVVCPADSLFQVSAHDGIFPDDETGAVLFNVLHDELCVSI